MTGRSVHEASRGKPGASRAGAKVTPPAGPCVPRASGKPAGTLA
ncbi:hypothetical protein [Paraburkholderia caffeinilytica]|nr:hypothetical protein [Paraburkholderia caffeinilytica]CAB3775626.1 hypothetical protein LMG28690_00035 [Paraburkholderia caffeinilytica]